jgi:quinol monooxygenase YgiN
MEREMHGSYHVVVRLTPRSGCEDSLAAELRSLAAVSRATPGCVRFVVTQDVEANNDFWLFEGFRSKAAYDEHVSTPHAQHFLHETLLTLVAERDVTAMVLPPAQT